jgi:glutaredoxin 3
MATIPDVKAFVNEQIANSKVVVFSKSYCPYCTRAKNLLKEQGLEFTLFELDNMKQGSEIQSILKELSGQSTVPNIFINQKHVGGCDDLTKVVRNGKLKSFL